MSLATTGNAGPPAAPDDGGQSPPSLSQLAARAAGWFGSFTLSAAAAFASVLNAGLDESFNHARFSVVLGILLTLHLLRYPKILFCQESAVYACLLCYMALSTVWTPDPRIAVNTLLPGLNFLLLLMLFGSLVMFHHVAAVLSGMLFGFSCGAGVYTVLTGFPLTRPPDFSYNAIAGMYLFGLFSIFVWGWYARQRLLCLLMATVAMMLIAATTSIKTNLGVLLGVISAAAIYLRTFTRILGQSSIALLVVSVAISYAVLSNEALLKRLQDGVDRVTLGVQILSAREDQSQGTSFNDRQYWQKIGLKGWTGNPVFGSGVEAFRADVGITSHSTPIDVLYNFGLIGFALYYALFVMLARRLYIARRVRLRALPVLIFSGTICYLFMSLSEPLHYNSFFAVFIAVNVALLRRQARNELAADSGVP
ncbi:MAG TPA: O-antigen ligase family protein [Steroidobacteraceae bacterium]|nr:O-antigen ligase family protein [Steroidobacteraceae bacterium]